MSNTRAPFSIRRRIEFANCDPAGIVFFVEFFRMCSTAFEEWLTDQLGIAFAEEFFVHDHMFPVVHADADFKKPLRMGDQLDIELVLTGLGRSSIHYTCIGRSAAEDVFPYQARQFDGPALDGPVDRDTRYPARPDGSLFGGEPGRGRDLTREDTMAVLPRLNGVIAALDKGGPTFTSFATADVATALAFSTTRYDGIVFEMEHNPWDIAALRDSLQYLLNRAQIAGAGSIAPAVTPMVRIPTNGEEKGQWHAKQALDLGVYGIVWPHISTADQAYNAVAACRYPRLRSAQRYEPAGVRGDGPTAAARYWGLGQQDYYRKADVWPLDPGRRDPGDLDDRGYRRHREPGRHAARRARGSGRS